MSRLRSLYLPFVSGSNDAVDPKVLPDGMLADVRNARLLKTGQVGLRRGWRPISTDTITEDGIDIGSPDTGGVVDLYSTSRGLVALVADKGTLALQSYVQHTTATPWVRRISQFVPPATRARADVGAVPDLPDDVTRVSCAVTADGVWGATLALTATQGALRVFRLATNETRALIPMTAAVAKVVSLGTAFGVVDNTGTALRLRTLTPTSASGALSAGVTLVTATVTQFDVASATESTPTRLHLAYIEAGAVTYRQFNTAGTEQGTGKTVSASGAQAAALASDDVTVHVVYQDDTSDELSLLSFLASSPSFTTTAGPTALNAGTAYDDGEFAVGYTANGNPNRIWVAASDGTLTDFMQIPTDHLTVTRETHDGANLAGGWVTWQAYAGIGLVRGGAGARDAYYTDNDGPWLVQTTALAANPFPGAGPWAAGIAPTGDVLTAHPRRSDLTPAQSLASGQVATRQAGLTAWRVGALERRPGVEFAGALYVSGGVLLQYVAGGASENGFLRPVLASVAQSNSTGTIANGTYEYRVIVVWVDGAGRTHRSPVSEVEDIVMAGANDTVTAVVRVAKTLRRDADLDAAPVVELYRTEAGPGELFYHVASTSMTNFDDEVTVIDTSPDADIINNKRLYTEGEFGAVSGALDIAMAPASAYVATLRDRIVLGSAGPDYALSQTALPEEPVAFADPGFSGPTALVYQDAAEGDLTGVATLDDSVILGTATRLYVTAPVGPGPNLAGIGEFTSPARLPTDVGFYDARSLVEDAAGLWFLGAPSRLYVLPRGEASPTFAGAAAEDRFGAGETVGAGREQEDDLTAWAVAVGSAGLLVGRHTESGQWLTDALPFTPAALVSHQGELYATDDDGGVWSFGVGSVYGDGTSGATAVALALTTGDVQVFGLGGWGRTAVVEVLGEFRSAAALVLEVSYDSGASWTALTTQTVTGLAAGEMFQRSWDLPRQRSGKFRLRLTMTPSSTTAEGCRLNGVTVYYQPRNGQTRLDSAKRR